MPPKSLLDFFTRSLASFQSTPSSTLRILCTLPHHKTTATTTPDPHPRPSSSPLSALTVLDSSFNPPTTAHLSMLLSSRPQRILLLLSVNNADKAPQPASFAQRLCMMHALATEYMTTHARDDVAVDIGVTTKAYFHEKAAAVTESGFYAGEGEQIYLAGFDTLIRIFNAKYYPEGMTSALDPFFERCRLHITARPDEKWGHLAEQEGYLAQLPRVLEEEHARGWWADRVTMVRGDGDGVSSSRVRDVVSGGGGDELNNLVGREVREWIERENLYKT